MPAPILLAPVVVAAGQKIMEMALAQSNNDRKIAKYNADAEKAQMLKAIREKELEVEKTAIEATKEIELARIAAQREIAQRLIDLAATVFERKSDMLQSMYDQTSQTIQDRITDLTAVQKELRSQVRQADADTRRDLMEEARYVGNELADLQAAMASLNADFTSAMTILEISGTPSQSALLGKL